MGYREHKQVQRRSFRAATRPKAAFSIIELLLVMTVLSVAFVALSRSLVGSMALNEVNRESALAQNGARAMVEVLGGCCDFDTVFSRYNSNPLDDPAGGPSPGSGFAVPGLDPVDGDVDGLVGTIVFPTRTTAGVLELREDLNLPDLGMPRDLNGDGFVDSADHSGDYKLLPFMLQMEWKGKTGQRFFETRSILADR